MRGDVAAASTPGVAAKCVPAPKRPAAQSGEPAFHAVEQIPIAYQQAHQRQEIVALPFPVHVGFRGPDAAADRDGAVRAELAHADDDPQGAFIGGARAHRHGAQRVLEHDLTAAHSLEPADDQSSKQPVHSPRAVCTRRMGIPDARADEFVHEWPVTASGWVWMGLPFAHRRRACQ